MKKIKHQTLEPEIAMHELELQIAWWRHGYTEHDNAVTGFSSTFAAPSKEATTIYKQSQIKSCTLNEWVKFQPNVRRSGKKLT
jgi:hypothetical protein